MDWNYYSSPMDIRTIKKYIAFLIAQIDRAREDLKLTPQEIREITAEVDNFQKRIATDTNLPETLREKILALEFNPDDNLSSANFFDRVLNLLVPDHSNFDESARATGLENLETSLRNLQIQIEMDFKGK